MEIIIYHFKIRDDLKFPFSHLSIVWKSIEDVVRKAWEQVNHEPTFEIGHADDARVGDDLTRWAHECHVKIEHDVNEEDYIDDAVDDEYGDVVHGLALEGSVVGHHDGSVEG